MLVLPDRNVYVMLVLPDRNVFITVTVCMTVEYIVILILVRI